MTTIWNPNIKLRARIIFICLGVIFILISGLVIYHWGNARIILRFPAYIWFSLFFFLGLFWIFLVFNYRNSHVKWTILVLLMLFVSIGLLIGLLFVPFLLQVFGVLLGAPFLYLLIVLLKNVVSTFVVTVLTSLFFLGISIQIDSLLPNYTYDRIAFLVMAVYLILYRIWGEKINKWVIRNWLSLNTDDYQLKTLKANIYFFYAILFVCLNVLGLFYDEKLSPFVTLINNIGLLAILIFQVDWKAMIGIKAKDGNCSQE